MDHRGEYAGLYPIVEHLIPYSIMSKEEFRQKDLELLKKIADLDTDNCNCEAQIATNNKRIVALNFERVKLREEFDKGK